MTMSYNISLSVKLVTEPSCAPGYPPQPMQTRWLLIASAVLAFVIIGAAAVWFLIALI